MTGVSAGTKAASSVCPKGTPLLEFRNNTAHSNGRYGFRVYDEYYPTEFPCKSYNKNSNKYVTSRFKNFTTYRNKVNGIQISAVSQLIMENFIVADNVHAGFEMPGAQGGVSNNFFFLPCISIYIYIYIFSLTCTRVSYAI